LDEGRLQVSDGRVGSARVGSSLSGITEEAQEPVLVG